VRSGALITGWQELGDVIVGDRVSKTSRGDARVAGQHVRIRPSAKKLLNGLTLPAGLEDGSEKGRIAERVLGVDGWGQLPAALLYACTRLDPAGLSRAIGCRRLIRSSRKGRRASVG
jgi:hypothetical protein